MPIQVIAGLPGSGKTLMFAYQAKERLIRNRFMHEKKGKPLRKLAINIKFASLIDKEFKHYIVYWRNTRDFIKFRDTDIFIDEIATYFDRTGWDTLSPGVRSFLRLHRHYHCKIWGTTQAFADVVVDFRRLVDDLWLSRKLLGSRDKEYADDVVSPTWGVCIYRTVKPESYKKDLAEMVTEGFPGFIFIRRSLTEIYNTSEELESSELDDLQHVEFKCEKGECSYRRLVHR